MALKKLNGIKLLICITKRYKMMLTSCSEVNTPKGCEPAKGKASCITGLDLLWDTAEITGTPSRSSFCLNKPINQ